MKIDRYIEKFDEDKKIKQSNKLVEAKYRLTLTETKIVMAIASQISKSGSEFENVRISVSALIDFCRFPRSKGYSMIREACCSLRSRVVHIKIDAKSKSWYMTGFINSAYYHDSVIDFTFDKKLKDFMLNVKQAYVSSQAKMLCMFKKDLTVRLYMLLRKAVNLQNVEYELDFIRERFMLPKSYKKLAHFEKKFLRVCVDEINEKSDINVKYEFIKSSKSYKKVKFIISAKTKKVETKLLTTSRNESNFSEEEKAALDKLTSCEVMYKRAVELIKKFGAERCSAFADLFKRKKEKGEAIRAGLLITLIEDESEQIPDLNAKKKQNDEIQEKIRKEQREEMNKNKQIKSEFFRTKLKERQQMKEV